MTQVQIGKYKRPGIFIEEYDNSIMATQTVDGITNMVIGISKKGPINTPIKITTASDLEAIFGGIDRGLERKGSYFHRTILKMIESSPVYAINLLSTDDTLDKIEYKSLSSSSLYSNDILREGAYRKFFDTTGFWKRDTESFNTLAEGNTGYTERAFNITNVSDRFITVFIVKTARTGFDRTLIEWYGSQEKLPPYVNANDYASDYMVDVLIVGGDWSNYQTLAIDKRWSAYFNTSGLIKSEIRNFANDRNITLLGYYEGLSVIPYFRDNNGNNLFIETIINRDTDKTGLFCAFNAELVEADYYNGMLDLVGQTIAGTNATKLEFLSYKESISESINIIGTPLDLPGNVTSLNSIKDTTTLPHAYGLTPSATGIIESSNRTAYFSEGYIWGMTGSNLTTTTASISINYTAQPSSYAVIGDNMITLAGTTSITSTLSLTASDYVLSSTTQSYVSTFVLDSTGNVKTLTSTTTPVVSASDIVLGYVTYNVVNQQFATASAILTQLNINNSGFVQMSTASDYTITEPTTGTIKIEFTNTIGTNLTYEQQRRIKMFNRIVSLISSSDKNKMAICLGSNHGYIKASLENMTIANIVNVSTSNKSFELITGLTSAQLTDIVNGEFVLYTIDNEYILGKTGVSTIDTLADTAGIGVAGKYSDVYTNFYDGIINSGDYFYGNKLTQLTDITLLDGETATQSVIYAGKNYIVFESYDPSFVLYDKIMIPGSLTNTSTFTINSDSSSAATIASALGLTGFGYEVVEEVNAESLYNQSVVYDINDIHTLNMYLSSNNTLNMTLVDPISVSKDIKLYNSIFVQSAKSNYKQTIEIETSPVGYVEVPNKILVKTSRYTEVKIGDYLAAYVDETQLEIGEVARKLTRILSKKQYAGDTTLTEITCDSAIDKINLGTPTTPDYQTTRYLSVDNYANTYKAITLKGFRIRQDSMPDGTEVRQNTILNLVAKGTPLFKAITNKDSIDFRYLIDSFGLGLTEKSKQQLVDICGDRLDAFGFINMPSMKSFKNSSSPSFVDADGVLSTEFIAKGGNPESSPAFLYTFAEGNGATTVGYFTPYVKVNDNGRPIDVPPAAFVATTYMRKHIANISGLTPWTIAAGVTNGRVTNIVGTEMQFTLTDIENLNMAQMNPIVFKRNRGNVIETENTAQTLYDSALSFIHSREVLIELERELSAMLLDYQWKFNTPDVRAEIKHRADTICETFVSRNGLYNYFNKMDEENNTPEIIDNQMGVLSVYCEIVKGMSIIVNNITILKTGSISAGGFMNQ